ALLKSAPGPFRLPGFRSALGCRAGSTPMNVIEIVTPGRRMDAPGLLAAVVGLDAQGWIDPGAQGAGVLLPGMAGQFLPQFPGSGVALPAFEGTVAPVAFGAADGGIVGGSDRIEMAALLQHGQVG